MPRVSVIIPTYNRANMVGRAIKSVLEQTFTDWELIVVDDGSQDHTGAAVADYGDPRIQYIYQENSGTPGARNTGIQASSGEYIALLDSDDLFLPNKLELQLEAMAHPSAPGLVASGWREVDIHGTPGRTLEPWLFQPGLALEDWLYGCYVIVPAVLVKRDWLIKVGMFDTSLRYVEDWDLWLRLAYAGCPMRWQPGQVCLRTVHVDSKIRNIGAMNEGLFQMLENFFAQPNLPDSIKQQRQQVYARAHVDSMVRAFGAGVRSEGESHLANAVHQNPALLEGDPPAVLHALASTALTHLVNNREQYIADVCRSLPKVAPQIACTPRQFKAMIQAVEAFETVAQGRRQQARIKAAQALFADPAWVRNRGLLSILLKP